MEVVLRAAPTPVLGSADRTCVQGVAFDVAADREKVPIVLDGERFESSLVEVAAASRVSMGVPALRMGQGQPARIAREIAILSGPKHLVPMVRHYLKSQEPHVIAVNRFLDNPLEGLVVVVVFEDRHSCVSAVQDVVDHPLRRLALVVPWWFALPE